MSTTAELLGAVRTAAKNLESSPYCTGTFPWDKDKSTLFYKSNEESRFLNFPATDSQLESLFDACSEGKIDAGGFATSFSPCSEGLVGILEELLPREHVETRNVKVELSKLNVYGPNGPSEAHLDTPPSMIASFTVILPTVHEGGSLILRHDGKEWTVDSSKTVSKPSAQAAFIVSTNDVKQEVQKITSGYLVTLSYNLYLSKKRSASIFGQETEPGLKEALDRLLRDQTCFPNGGFIGFSLSHKYPFLLGSTDLSDIKENLKGSDEAIKRACERVSLEVSVKGFYGDEFQPGSDEPLRGVLLDRPENLEFRTFDESVFYILSNTDNYENNVAVAEYGEDGDWDVEEDCPIVWLRPIDNDASPNSFQFFYLNEHHKWPVQHGDADLCLVAKIPPPEGRVLPTVPDTASSGSERERDDSDQNKKSRLSTDG